MSNVTPIDKNKGATMTDKKEFPSYADSLKELLTFVSDIAKDHPDPAVRERAANVAGDFMIAALLSIGTRGADK